MKETRFINLLRRSRNFYQRKRSYLFEKKPGEWRSPEPLISFTFDDFPRSAYLTGGEILKKHGVLGSYYASMALMGKSSPSGEIFSLKDLRDAMAEGHEIGSHTYDHMDAWGSKAAVFEESLEKNLAAMRSHFPEFTFRTMSYPLKEPHPRIKKIAGMRYSCCRGGGQTFNFGRIDLNLLRSCFIDKKNREDMAFFRGLIEENVKQKGWLIFSTHDVEPDPSYYGCEPDIFEDIVRLAVYSTAVVLPVGEVYLRIFGS